MINIREFEIRDEATSLTVAAYQLLSDLAGDIHQDIRTNLVDRSFLVSSLIAEAFRTSHSATAEDDIKLALHRLLELKTEALALENYGLEDLASLEKFIHIAEELQVELTELLSAINLLNAETFSPKIGLACI